MSKFNEDCIDEVKEDDSMVLAVAEIEAEYEKKINDVVHKITGEYDTVIIEIKNRLTKKYQEISDTLKLKRDLKERLKELKILLKTFKKEGKILTRNKQKVLDEKIKVLDEEREHKISEITGEPPKSAIKPSIELNPDIY